MKFLNTSIICSVIFIIQFNFAYAQQRSESDDFSYALKLYNERFYDLAAKQFSRFVNNYPGSNKVAEAGYYSGMSLFYLKDYENARIEFQRVAVDFPRHDRSADSWFMVGECYELLDNDAEAAKAFEMVKILHPQHERAADSILRAGKLYQKLKKYESAEQLYNLIQNRYIESSSYFPSVLASGTLYFEKGQPSRAKEKLEKVIESDTDEKLKAQAWYYLGESYRVQGNYQQAVQPFQTVVKNFKKTNIYPDAALSLSRIYLQQEKYSDAQRVISEALNNNPPGIYISEMEERLGDAYYLNSKFALAGKSYQTTLDAADSSKYLKLKLKLALSWYKQNNIDKATTILREVVTNAHLGTTGGFHSIKDLYFSWIQESRRFEKGIADLYILKRNNNFSRTDLAWLGQFLKIQGDWLGVIRELQPAIYADDKFELKDDFIFEVAFANQKLNRYEESARFFRMIIEEYPSSELASEAEKRLQYLQDYYLVEENVGVGQMAVLMGDIISGKEDAQLQFKLGQIYYTNLKDYTSALSQFSMALNQTEDPSLQVDIYHYIGLTYQKLAESVTISTNKKTEYLQMAKDNLGKAMEKLSAAIEPDNIAWHFVSLGILADNSPPNKQIGYIETLLKQYPESRLREQWYEKLGQLYGLDENNLESSLKYYNALISQFSMSRKFPVYVYERAMINLRNDRSKAVDDFKLIAGSYPHSQPAANALYNLGVMWQSEANYEQAAQVYEKVLAEYFYTDLAAKAKVRVGDTYLYSGKYSEAVDLFQQIIDPVRTDDIILNRELMSSDQSALTFKLALSYFNLNEWNNARNYFINYMFNNPQGEYSSEASYHLGEIYLSLNDPNSAVASYQNVTSKDIIYYPLALQKIGDIYFESEEYDKAAVSYEKLSQITEDNAEKADILGKQIVSLIRSGKKSSADKYISQFSAAYKSDLNHLASFQFEYGEYYRKTKNFNQAVNFFTKVKKSYSKSSWVDDADYYLALTYIAVNRHDDALNILTSFAKNYPKSENLGAVLNTLGSIYFRSEKYESAITSFKSALDKPLKPEVRRQVLSNLIKAYTFVNFWDAALGLAREYIETYPDADDVIDKKILMGRAYVALNQVDRAVQLLKETRLIADSEREPEIQFYIGDAYFQTGQYESAIAEFVKIPLLSRKTKLQWEASALYYSGQAYEKLGRIDDAQRMYTEIVKRPGIDLVLKKEAQKRIKEIEQL